MLFFPVLLFKTSSRFNPDIRVVREWGGMKLLVNRSRQSGPYIKKLWERAFRAFRLDTVGTIKSILVLGIGGGTVIDSLAKQYPTATITAVDIDPTIINIAKEYFGVSKLPNVGLVQEDAEKFVYKKMKPFDLIIVDLFIGREIPKFVESVLFHRALKRLCASDSVMVINYLRELEYQKKSDALFQTLKTIFRDVRDFPVANNRFFFARP